MKEERVINC